VADGHEVVAIGSSPPREAFDDLVGCQLGRYVLDGRLELGGAGRGYLAHRVPDGERLAVKVLRDAELGDPHDRLRFEREGALCGRLSHPNLVSILDAGVSKTGAFVALEHVDGPTLSTYLAQGAMSSAEVLELGRQLCTALAEVHALGFVHRDVTTATVMLAPRPGGRRRWRLTGFGVATRIVPLSAERDRDRRLHPIGTPAYWAPEQALSAPVDQRVDLFSLGVTLYRALAGRMPFDGDARAMAKANLTREAPPLRARGGGEVDPLVEALIRRLMARRLGRRPANAHAALALIAMIEDDRAAAARELRQELQWAPVPGGDELDLLIAGLVA
jgi:serine/threonine-protein kinase